MTSSSRKHRGTAGPPAHAWRHTEECGAARPTSARHAGSDGLKRLVGAAMNADTRPGARPRTPLAAAMLFPSSWTRPPSNSGWQARAQPWRRGLPGSTNKFKMSGAVSAKIGNSTPYSVPLWEKSQRVFASKAPALNYRVLIRVNPQQEYQMA